MSDLNAYAVQVEALACRQAERIEHLEAENERLRRMVECCRKHGPVSMVPGHPGRLQCTLCGKWNHTKPAWSPEPNHSPDCPHNTEAK